MNARFYLPSTGRFLTADTIVPDPAEPQDYNRYSYVLNNPTNLVDPSGHFSEGAIWGHIYDNVCYPDMECTVNTLNAWKGDAEWWDMLLAAQAGDVIITSNGNYVFRGEGKHLLTGISFGYSDGSYSDWAPNDIYSLTLNDLFNKKDDREWVGLIQCKDDGTLSDILLRLSAITEAYTVIDIPEAGTAGPITQLGAFGLCSLATGSLSGGSACSRTVALTIRLGKFWGNPHGLEQGDQVYETPAGTFVYRGTQFSPLDMISGQPAVVLQMEVYYYGGLFFVPELMATCNWNENGYICN